MNVLKREQLTEAEYQVLRDVPHLVAMAVSASGGSFVDEIIERTAATDVIAEGSTSDHPLLQKVAGLDDIKAAQRSVRARILARDAAHRSPSDLERLAVDAAREAMAVIVRHGSLADTLAYREYVLKVARRVAGAAREGDLFGVGGEAVSAGERAVIISVEEALQPAL